MAKKYPGKVSEEFPNGKNWHVIEMAGLSRISGISPELITESPQV